MLTYSSCIIDIIVFRLDGLVTERIDNAILASSRKYSLRLTIDLTVNLSMRTIPIQLTKKEGKEKKHQVDRCRGPASLVVL